MNRLSSTARTGLWPMGEPPHWSRRRAAALTTLAVLAVLIGVPACVDRPLSPLPVRPPSPAASTVATAPPTTAPGPSTATPPSRSSAPSASTRSRTARPTPPSACLGPVRYDLVLAETELALLKSLCLATGGVLRIRGIGPGLVTVDRTDLVSRSYEAGVVDIRFVRTGTVVVTIPQNGRTYPITVVVV
ncbi:hypothetical protein ABZV78_14980 [Micromonospora sp. NPDC004540]|uniref:hypothetical protein n=1 Tax=Micromonospora sp. NPDC004540 TaxID=3154457 RepID=UPI0033BADADC